MRLFRYLFLALLVTGISWGFHHQDQLAATVRPIAMLGQFGAARQSSTGSAPTPALSAGRHALYYTPEVNPERVDVPLLTKARGHIDAAFYSFTDKPTAEALLAAANRGVKVRIYRDQEQFQDEKNTEPVHDHDVCRKSEHTDPGQGIARAYAPESMVHRGLVARWQQ